MEEFKKAYYELVKEHGFEIIPQITLGVRKIEMSEPTGTDPKLSETSEPKGTE